MNSLFGSLELEEPGEDPLGPASKDDTGPKTPRRPKLETECKSDDAFRTWCFLQDLADIRASIKDTWQGYAKGEISFFAAGVITDTAFGMLRRADEEFAKTSPFGSTEWKKLLKFLGITYFTSNNAVWMRPAQNGSLDMREADPDVNTVELLCPVAFLCLEYWQADAHACCRARKRLTVASPSSVISAERTYVFHPLSEWLFENVSEIHGLAHAGKSFDGDARDEFLRGLIGVHNSSSICMWIVVAIQASMDILDLLADHASHGVALIRQETARVECLTAAIKKYNPTGTWETHDTRNSVGRLGEVLTYALGQKAIMKLPSELPPMPSSREEASKKAGKDRGSTLAAYLPALTGNRLGETKVCLYDISTAFASDRNYMLSVAHIYRSLRARGVLNQTWQDMEFGLASFAPGDLLAPKVGPPYDRQEAQRHYLLALGISPSDLGPEATRKAERDGLLSLKVQGKRAARTIHMTSPILNALCDRATKLRSDPNARTFAAVLKALNCSDSTTVTQQKQQKNAKEQSNISATELLTTLRRRLLKVEPTLNFDPISLTIDCAELLNSLGLLSGPSDSNALDARSVQSLLLAPPESKMCRNAAEIFKAHIERNGKKLSKAANDQSSGRIPRESRPSVKARQDAIRIANEAACNLLDCCGVKYSFTGWSLAAYHVDFEPKLAERFPSGRATWRILTVPFRQETIERFLGPALPDGTRAGVISNRDILRDFMEKNARGEVSDADFRDQVITSGLSDGLELVKVTVPQVLRNLRLRPARDVWALRVHAGHYFHSLALDALMPTLGSQGPQLKPSLRTALLPYPLLGLTAGSSTDEAVTSQLDEEFVGCSNLVREELGIRSPQVQLLLNA